jgi:general secretion pathway protein E
MSFARALRAILRQDPDVIMIGEIRDLETAQIAVQASLTGHLVLATLHTNSAAGAVTRLADMGIEPYLLASTLTGVLAQRLVRKCVPGKTDEFKGRTGIYELLVVDDAMRRLIHDNAAESLIAQTAAANGMATLREDGERWIAAGVTTRDEVLRVTRE